MTGFLVKMLGWLVTIAAAMVMLGFAAFLVVPRLLGWETVVVLSGSMEPTLNVGGVVMMEPVDPFEIEPGDIVSFEITGVDNEPALVTHRVLTVSEARSGRIFQTKGDANEDPDPFQVEASAVRKIAVWDAPYLGRMTSFISSRNGYYALIAAPGILLVLSELSNIVRQVQGPGGGPVATARSGSRPSRPALFVASSPGIETYPEPAEAPRKGR